MPTAADTYNPRRHTRKGPPPLLDPRNVNSQLGPGDFRIADYNPDIHPANAKYNWPGHDLDVLQMLQDRVTSAINYKRYLEPDWYEALAYYMGRQDLTWNYRLRQLVPMRNATNYHKRFGKRNKIKGKVKKLTFQAFSQKPDAAIKASTMSDLDRQAAAEGRSVLSHTDYKFHRDQQVRRMGFWAFIVGTVALGFSWNEKAAAEMPVFDKSGQIVGSEIVDGMGEIEERIYPVFKLLMDPQARDYDSMGWIIDQDVLDLEYIRTQWLNGKYVDADAGQGVAGYMESRLAAVLGEPVRGSEPGPVRQNTAVIYRCFEPPTDIYPDGRMMICSSRVLLRYEEEWPHMDARKLATMGVRVPYAFMFYEEGQGSLYGSGIVPQMIDAQKDINKAVSREVECLDTSWGKLLIEEGSRIGATAFDDARPNEKITYARGSTQPQHLVPDFSVMEAAQKLKQEAEADLDDISGLHEISEAQMPAGADASGVAVSKLQQSDAVMQSVFAANIEEFHRQRATIEIHVVGKNYTEPRLLFISEGYFGDPSKKMQIPGQDAPPAQQGPPQPQDMPAPPPDPNAPPDPSQQQGPPPGPPQLPPYVDDPDTALMDVKSFKALQNGGSCHVMITPGSALAKDPDARKAEVLELMKYGAFGPPGDPGTLAIVLALLEYAAGDEILMVARKAYAERIKVQMATAPNPAGAAQVKAQADLALENVKGQREIGLIHSKQEAEQSLLQLKAQLDQQKLTMETQADIQMKQAEQLATLRQAVLDKLHPDLKLSGTLTPVETAALLQTMGLPTPDADHLMQASQATVATAQHGAATAQHGVTQAEADAQSAQAGIPAAQANAQEAAANADQAQQIADQPLPPPESAGSTGE